jgi:cyclophilin family peptidyl-prolyl cis-trans isomerase/HEAT repeat protein
VVQPLSALLRDPVSDVRIAAAFALGQTGSKLAEPHLVAGFAQGDSMSQQQRYNAVVLEAVGKCGTANTLKNIAAVTTYQPTDTLLLQGQCRAIYRFGVRKITDPSATELMVKYCADENIPEAARLMAAHYLARTEGVAPDSAQAVRLAVAFVRAQSPEVRMAIAKGLGKSQTGPAFRLLSSTISTETDWRVKCNIINALAKFDYDTVRQLVIPAITDANVHVSRTASEYFIANGRAKDGDYYWRIARNNGALPWQSQVALYHASNKWLASREAQESKDYINFRLREIYQNSNNPYEQAACLRGLSEFVWQYNWIYEKGRGAAHPAIKSAAAEALRTICERPDFYSAFGEGSKDARRNLYYYLRELIATGDPGIISEASAALAVDALNYKSLRDSARVDNLNEILGRLKMPRDVEAYQALQKTIAYFAELPPPVQAKPGFNHPIEWASFALIKPETRAKVETSKGTFEVGFYPEWAPGSVLNFINLAKDGFFDNKNFHRVVPNFVVQGGCPRGDGYGALDYTIRTEIGPVWYDEPGMVGMASAGNDTEGTQWFVTHSPTPHLDGRYTIFGKVKTGLDVVHQLQVGDKILKVTIQ